MTEGTSRLERLMAIEPEFRDALVRGERWALLRADVLQGLDGLPTNRRHPERAFTEDGITKKNWCGTCAHKDGCITCDLDGDYDSMRGYVGKFVD